MNGWKTKIALFTLMISLLGGFLACGNNSQNQRETYAYQYIVQGCDTKRHAFITRAAYCDGLKDHSANNNCAYDERRAAYESASCGGRFD